MKRLLLGAALAVLASACRTEIQPIVKGDAQARRGVTRGPAECQVRDYPLATDVPSGAKSLGRVKVDRQDSEEATFELLRKKVCELGGDAMSQMQWIRAAGASVADPPIELEGHAWALKD